MEAALFDLDGVVVYTDTFHSKAWTALAHEQGWVFDESYADQLRGVSRMESLAIILRANNVEASRSEQEAWAERKNNHYRELLSGIDEASLVPGAVGFIQSIKAEGLKIGLGSSSKNAEMVLDALGLTPLFDTIVTGHDIERSKPDPQIFLMGAERLSVPPHACIVFEDAASGVQAALAAGMTAVGFGPSEGLDDAQIRAMAFSELDPGALSRL